MRIPRLLDLSLALVGCLGLVGCGDKEAKPTGKPEAGGGTADAGHKAPHGGELLEFGAEEAHVELVHDAGEGKLTLYVFGSSLDKPLYVAKPTVTLAMKDKDGKATTAEVALTSTDAKPDGTGHTWTATHDGLKVDPLDGRIRFQVGDKNYQSALEPAGHSHK